MIWLTEIQAAVGERKTKSEWCVVTEEGGLERENYKHANKAGG